MKSRSARLALFVLFAVALAVTAYLFRKSEAAEQAELTAGQAFTAKARDAARHVLDLRAAQQAYVATGQGHNFWASRVTQTLDGLRESLGTLRASASARDSQSNIDAAAGHLQDFGQMDTRAREYVRTNQDLLAADMIFSNGTELTDAAVAALDQAAASEMAARNAAADTFGRREAFALVAAAFASGLVVLLLLPGVERETPAPPFVERSVPAGPKPVPVRVQSLEPFGNEGEGWSSARRTGGGPTAVPGLDTPGETLPAVAAADQPLAAPPSLAPASAAVPSVDLRAVAALCTELSRVDDTMALPPLLDQAASVLDAAGIILWIADPDGRELNPVLAQGYPQHLINRLGTIPRGAENATAAAFRTGLLQTVNADGISNGAIAAPLVACGGCVGVMAAEVRGDGEKQEAKLAAATILAAQLASLVGPPVVRDEAKIEAANA
jgi:CHASE3 domain sensor protein